MNYLSLVKRFVDEILPASIVLTLYFQVVKEEIEELHSNHEETDTRVVLYARYAAREGYKSVRVKSPDSDVFFILLHHSPTISCSVLFDTGIGNNKQLLNISRLASELGEMKCSALLSVHALTGCDTTSALRGIGKVKPIKLLDKETKFQEVLVQIEEEWKVTNETMEKVEQFICCLYGKPKMDKIDDLRLELLSRKCKDMKQLDPKKILTSFKKSFTC